MASKQPLDQWRQQLLEWRNETVVKHNLSFPIYNNPHLNWTRTTQVQPQVHPWDRFLFDERRREFTVDRYLADLNERYGGIDSVLLWPTYPTLGLDARNQFDLWRAFPGGLRGAARLVADFQQRGVRVLFPFNPFDQGLRDEGEPTWLTLVKLLKEIGADGFNGDTMYTMPKQVFQAAVEMGHPIVGEMEDGGYASPFGWDFDAGWAHADWDALGWGYYFEGKLPDGISRYYSREPGVDKAKWLDRQGRRQTHVCDRWAKDRHDALQFAHFNGVGFTSWENVWGVFMKFTERDGEALRRLSKLWKWLRAEQFIQGYADWHPFAPEVAGQDLYSSRWVHADGACAWTVVNRGEQARHFDLAVAGTQCVGELLFDLYAGRLVQPEGQAIEGLGYGAYLFISRRRAGEAGLSSLLEAMRRMTVRPLSSFSGEWAPLPQRLVPPGQPRLAMQHPEGMALIPRSRFHFQTAGVEVEGGCDHEQDSANTGTCCTPEPLQCPSSDHRCFNMCGFAAADDRGVDVQFPWEPTPRRFHSRWMDLGPFYIDQHLVTNADFAVFLKATNYRPRDRHNFLRSWVNATHFVADHDRKPVTWVSFEEARAYCAWKGKRLPHAWEWQLAAQGTDNRTYPWGNDEDSARFPAPGHGRAVPELPEVGAFPQGRSVFNVSDLVGHVWQFTDAFEDEHTRAVLLKGSSLYNPQLSGDFPALPQAGNWYFPVARKLTQHNKLMLFDEAYDRAETLGFRCVAEHPEGAPGPLHLHGHAVSEAELARGEPARAGQAGQAGEGQGQVIITA